MSDKFSEMTPTKEAVIDVGRLCNVRCTICYYRYETFDAPEGQRQTWMKTIEQLKKEATDAKIRGCNRIDVTGGEPMIHKDIAEFIEYCTKLGMTTRIITNAQASDVKFYQVIGAGCKEFLFSVHALGEELDKITQKKGSWEQMCKIIDLVKERGCRFATNTVIMRGNYQQLPDIAEWISTSGAYSANFIHCNPRYGGTVEQHKDISVEVTKSADYVMHAIDMLNKVNIWVNVRYYPMCMLTPKYRKHIVNHPQVMFDPYEWDYGTWDKSVKGQKQYAREAFTLKSNCQTGKCGVCPGRNLCGGSNLGYIATYGDEELLPETMPNSDYEFYYRREQEACDIIIPMFNVKHNISRLLEELVHKTQPPYNIILLSNHQTAAANRNDGLIRSHSRFTIMLDDDVCELPLLWNKKLIDRLQFNPDVMCVSARLLREDGQPGLNSANNYNTKTDYEVVDMVPTACVVFRTRDWQKTGTAFDNRMMTSGYEDTDFFLRLKQRLKDYSNGTKVLIDNQVKVVHLNYETGAAAYKDYNLQVAEDNLRDRK